MKFLCEQCKAKYQIADDKVVGKTVRMKCRKCGHMIEVRAEVTETSVASDRPVAPNAPPGPPRPLGKPAPPRSTTLAASLTSPRPLAPKGGALAGAFKTTVQHEEEVSAPFDMSEISPNDDWYVAINGVPVGPVRVAEVRRKAVLGAVTEDSLVWQEGLDEWRPLRSFPDLAAIVRGATSGTRSSMTPPPPDARGSHPPPSRLSARPAQSLAPQRPPPPRVGAFGATPPPRNNVVAISSRLATAEKLADPSPFARPSALPQQAPAGLGADALAGAPASLAPVPRKEVPWMPITMLVMGIGFSVTLAITLTPKISEVIHPSSAVPSASAAGMPSASPTTAAVISQPTAEPTSTASPPSAPTRSGPIGAVARTAATATATGRSLDLRGLGGNGVALGEDPSGDGPKAPGQCFSEGQVQKVVQLHMVAVRRTCWERSQSNKPSVNVNVMLTIATDGSTQAVSASGDDPTVAKCIENDVRGWHFPAMGCSQKTAIPFKFLLQ